MRISSRAGGIGFVEGGVQASIVRMRPMSRSTIDSHTSPTIKIALPELICTCRPAVHGNRLPKPLNLVGVGYSSFCGFSSVQGYIGRKKVYETKIVRSTFSAKVASGLVLLQSSAKVTSGLVLLQNSAKIASGSVLLQNSAEVPEPRGVHEV